MHRGRGAARSIIGPILRAASYGDEKISPSVVAFSETVRMIPSTQVPGVPWLGMNSQREEIVNDLHACHEHRPVRS